MSKPDGYFENPRSEMLRLVPMDARTVIDVGCGSGEFGRLLKEVRPDRRVIGVELVPDVAQRARGVLDDVVAGAFPDVLDQLPAEVDCVVFNDVLEHMIDPWAALAAAHGVLSPGGVVVASIPNIRNLHQVGQLLLRGEFCYADDGVMDRTHLRFFTRRSIAADFDEAGFGEVAIRGIVGLKGRRTNAVARVLRVVFPKTVDELFARQFGVVAKVVPGG